MTRRQRTLARIARLEQRAIRSAMRATAQANAVGGAAIRSGAAAGAAWRLAHALRLALADRENAAKSEKQKRKLPTDWWRGQKRGL